jgi:hypothetical protein
MAVSAMPTHGLLDYWASRMGVSPWHFNQIKGAGLYAPLTDQGADVYTQLERDVIGEGIAVAVQEAAQYLQFYPRPVWFSGEIVPIDRTEISNPMRFKTRWKWVNSLGARAVSLIASNASVTYSDQDGDGTNETATITVSTSVTDPNEIHVFYRVGDRADNRVIFDSADPTDERWRIEPLRVSVSGGVATLTGHRSLFVSPALWALPYREPNYNASSKRAGDTSNTGDFVTQVDVYRVYADSGQAVRLCYIDTNGAIQFDTPTNVGIEDQQFGIVYAKPTLSRPYEYAVLNYRAGYPENGAQREQLRNAIIRLSNCRQPLPPTSNTDRRLIVDQFDTMVELMGDRPANEPGLFGSKNGELAAARVVEAMRVKPVFFA